MHIAYSIVFLYGNSVIYVLGINVRDMGDTGYASNMKQCVFINTSIIQRYRYCKYLGTSSLNADSEAVQQYEHITKGQSSERNFGLQGEQQSFLDIISSGAVYNYRMICQ